MLSSEEKNKRINQLWKRLASGDADAISAVILLLEKDLLKLAMKYLLNEQDANAVVNESFMKIFDNARKVRHRNNLYGWMKTIVVNSCLNHLKKNKNEVSLDALNEKFPSLFRAPNEDIVEQMHVRDCLTALDETERTVLLLHSQDYTLQEISKMTGLTVKRVRNRLKKSKENFKTLYEKGTN